VPSDESSISQHFGGTKHKAAMRIMVSQHRRPQSTIDIIIHKSTGRVFSECLPRITPPIYYITYTQNN
jgi:hypothetical protein